MLSGLLTERCALLHGSARQLPLLLKISPDLDAQSLASVVSVIRKLRIDGIVATNTTVQRPMQSESRSVPSGGLSGASLHALSLAMVRELRQQLGEAFPIIGVGGIDSAEKATAMRRAGADLVQIYTGLVYRGPSLVRKCVRALSSTQ